MQTIILYHGSDPKNYESILKHGFDMSLTGKGWGLTYGKGIYMTPDINEAKVYSGGEKILRCTVKIDKPLKLTRDYSPTNKKHKQQLSHLLKEGYDTLITLNSKEYVIFKSENIIKIEIV